jgi:hypothetical protein
MIDTSRNPKLSTEAPVMRCAVAILFAASLAAVIAFAPTGPDAHGQGKKPLADAVKKDDPPPKDTAKKDGPKEEPKAPPEEKFDQKKADIETVKTGGLNVDAKTLLEFFQKHTVSDMDRTRLTTLIKQLGDDDFDKREEASDEIQKFGVAAIGLLKQAERGGDPEVLRRCEQCLKTIEKVPTRTLASAAARLLADLKGEGTTETLLNYLPLAEDESVADDVRGTLAILAMKDGKPDEALEKALSAKDNLRRGAAAEAFARGGDKAKREEVRKLLDKDSDNDLKLRVAMALVTIAKDKDVVEPMIKLMAEVPTEAGWRAEEVMVRMAGEKGPAISLGGDKASRDKARDEWLKWWKDNSKDIDLAKLDETERTLGYTLLIEMDIRGIGGRVCEVGPDGKKRWEITNVQFPTDAVVIPGNHVVIAEQNTNRVSERDIANGKEIWGETVNQPIGLQRLANGNLVIVGRHQVFEWDRNRKPVTTITRQQYDIVAAAKLRNGQFAVFTQQAQIFTYDKEGKQLDTFSAAVGNRRQANYNSTMQVVNGGKVIVTLFQAIAEVDVNKKEAKSILNYNYPTSAQRLPNGNILVSNQNNYQVAEMDPKNNKAVWEYKVDNNNNNFYRPWRAKRR